jgi:hypothetical protein
MIGRALYEEVVRLGGDPSDPVWLWFLKRGPHGPDFTWGQTRRQPPGYVGVEHLQEIVEENAKLDTSFTEKARCVVARALNSNETQILRRAIQVAAVLGSQDELEAVSRLTKSENEAVVADAKACAFYLKRRLRAEPT